VRPFAAWAYEKAGPVLLVAADIFINQWILGRSHLLFHNHDSDPRSSGTLELK